MPPDLARTQRRFWELVTGASSVGSELPRVARADPDVLPLEGWVRGSDPVARLEVYARMVFWRLLDAIRSDYPLLSQLLGEARTHDLIAGYLKAHPSDQPSIRHVGRHLPLYLKGHALSREIPFAADLAALEWVRGLSFDAPDGAALKAEDLAGRAPEDWPLLRLVSSAYLLPLSHPAHEAWLALERGEPVPAIDPGAVTVAIWRVGFSVWHRPLEADESLLLESVQKGVTLAALCERVPGSPGEATSRAFALLQRWLEEGLLAG